MARATLFFEDNPDGTLQVGADFGESVDRASPAHDMATVLLQSVLKNARTYQTIEDTAPEVPVEPSRIITSTD